jgi:hypothetical protein
VAPTPAGPSHVQQEGEAILLTEEEAARLRAAGSAPVMVVSREPYSCKQLEMVMRAGGRAVLQVGGWHCSSTCSRAYKIATTKHAASILVCFSIRQAGSLVPCQCPDSWPATSVESVICAGLGVLGPGDLQSCPQLCTCPSYPSFWLTRSLCHLPSPCLQASYEAYLFRLREAKQSGRSLAGGGGRGGKGGGWRGRGR